MARCSCVVRGGRLEAQTATPMSTPPASATIDIVTAMDVLEHTDDDLAALRELRRVCKPGGLLLATVPAYGFLWSEHDEALKHRRRYTAHELRNASLYRDAVRHLEARLNEN